MYNEKEPWTLLLVDIWVHHQVLQITGQLIKRLIIISKSCKYLAKADLCMFADQNFTCIRIRAIAWPAGDRLPSCDGNKVAKATTIAVMQGRFPPWMPKYFVIEVAALQIANETNNAVALCKTGSLFPALFSEGSWTSAKLRLYYWQNQILFLLLSYKLWFLQLLMILFNDILWAKNSIQIVDI